MTARLRLLVLSPLVLVVLLSAAVFPLAALAEEATPPPPEITEVASTEAAAPTDPVESVASEEPPTADPTEASAAAAAPPTDPAESAPPDGTSEEPGPTAAATEAATLENIVAALPEGTDLVVLDENGEALPLASNEAAEIIANGDPMWCPAGHSPGDDECLTDYYGSEPVPFTNFNNNSALGIFGLVPAMEELSSNCLSHPEWCGFGGAGTIYVAHNYTTANEGMAIVINQADMPFFTDLTIQGGWDFSQDADNQPAGATSTFNEALSIHWLGNVTLNDLIFEEIDTVGGTALTVETTGDLTLDNVQVLDNDGVGAYLDNCVDDGSGCAGTGSIFISDSKFDRNYGPDGGSPRNGLTAYTSGGITLTRVEASENDWIGAELHKYGTGPGLISITGSTFSGNFLPGLVAEGDKIQLDHVLVSGNGWFYGWEGADLDNCIDDRIGGHTCPGDGYISITDSTFVHNGDAGLLAKSMGEITLTRTLFEHNGWVDLNGNGIMDGGELPGNLSYGALLNNCLYDDDPEGCSGSGSILITESLFNGNQAAGLQAYSSGAISMILSEASGNGLDEDADFWDRGGAALNNEDADGSPGILVDGSQFLGNAGTGLFAHSLGDIQLTDSEASGNGSAAPDSWEDPQGVGALLDNCAEFMDADDDGHFFWACRGSGSVTVEDSTFNTNEMSGLLVETFGAIALNEVHANSNGIFGADLLNDNQDPEGNRSTAAISISGPSTFGTEGAGNAGSGLQFRSFGNVSLSDIVASYNGMGDMGEAASGYGIYGYTEGEGVSMSVTDVTASHNMYGGVIVAAFGDAMSSSGPALGITLTDVVANSNGGYGGDIETDGNIWVDPSTFSDNDGDGLFVGASEALIECSTFTGNGDDGLSASVDGSITVSGCTFGGNGDDNINIWDGELVITAGDCGGSGGGDAENEPPSLPGILPSTGGPSNLKVVGDLGEQQVVDLVCTGIAGTVLQLTNGDHIELPCPIEGRATLHHQGEDTLPAGLADGVSYVSGMHLGMAPDSDAVQGLGGSIGLHFAVPSDVQGAALLVLHWDNGQWEQLSGTLSTDGYFETPHGQTGIYVLAAG